MSVSKALLYDATVCIGCKQCEGACATQNKLPYDDAVAAENAQSEHKLTVVLTRGEKFMRRLCMNCADPACASVCPVGALRKTAAGPVIYDENRCMGCRYCMVACPFSVPKYEWNKLLPRVKKCTLCPDRVNAGRHRPRNSASQTEEVRVEQTDCRSAMMLLQLLPIGELDGGLLPALAPAMADTFSVPCELVTRPLDPLFAYHRERQQCHSSEILQAMQNRLQPDSWRMLGVAEVDLYIPILTFVFGEAQRGDRAR